jgi:X-Pro dipeptidyl-peptidase (S15 family)
MDTPTARELMIEHDLWVTARDGVRLATDVCRPTSGGPFPVLLERTPYNKSAPSRSDRTAAVAMPPARRGRCLLYAARLCRRLSGLPRPVAVGGPLHKISERGRGRIRHPLLADAAILVQRPDWHIRSLLRGAHLGSTRLPRPARSRRAVSRLRRVFERLSQRHPP